MKRKDGQTILWTWSELCEALKLPLTDGPDFLGISFDSRQVQPGDLFVALPGDPGPRFNVSHRTNRDGHDFVEDALERGAVGALVHKSIQENCPVLKVEDTIDGLWNLARYRRNQLNCPIVAVTGSSGKTTLKSFLSQALPAFSTEGSYNNYIGLPLSIAVTPRDAEAAVYEIGTNHEGEIAPLSQLAQPNVAVVLNVLPVHIGYFPNIDALTVEKFSIYQGLTRSGTLVCSIDLSESEFVPKDIDIKTFGFDSSATLRVRHTSGHCYVFSRNGDKVEVEVPGGGKHRAETLAATASVLDVLDVSLTNLRQVTGTLPKGRGNTLIVNGVRVIDESYNANPTSMQAALQGLLDVPVAGRRIAVLAQMNELGDKAVEYHTDLAILASQSDIVLCVGDLMRHLYENLGPASTKRFFESVNEDLMKCLTGVVSAGDAVMIKGSHSFFWEAQFVDQFISKIETNSSQ